MKKISVVIFGHGSLCIWLSKYILKSNKYELKYVITSKDESIFDLSLKSWCKYNKIKSSENINILKRKKFNLGISIYYNDLLKKNLIKKFDTMINLHNSLLPEFRGVNPVNWAIKLRKPLGISLHKIEKKIDSGDIIFQRKIRKKNNVFLDTLQCKKEGILLLKKFLKNYPTIKYIKLDYFKKYFSIKKSSKLGHWRYLNKKKSNYKIFGNFLLNNFKKSKSSLYILNKKLPQEFYNDLKKKYHILLLTDKDINLYGKFVIKSNIKDFDPIYKKLIQNKIIFDKINVIPQLSKKLKLNKFKNLLNK